MAVSNGIGRSKPGLMGDVAGCMWRYAPSTNPTLQGSVEVFRLALLRLLCICLAWKTAFGQVAVQQAGQRCCIWHSIADQPDNLYLGLKLDKPYSAIAPK